ncbi:hypothetical protein ALC60_07134 [Trachymyrmex zeteki]|uniref:Uncharacterized protein n=1 Tax=Mycetomoellerius zeteki TaxID=64791 RepID=A0A151X0V3_9HYME|nr:hypothetical protein ALC60_07134 [Trachymyrmex zeteki]
MASLSTMNAQSECSRVSTDSRSINRDVKPEPVPPPNEWKIKKPWILLRNYFRCIIPPFTTAAATILPLTFTIYIPFSFVYITLPLDPCGLFSSVSTICIKYSETLGSIALYGDDPLDCPYLPVTYSDPIGSPPTLA